MLLLRGGIAQPDSPRLPIVASARGAESNRSACAFLLPIRYNNPSLPDPHSHFLHEWCTMRLRLLFAPVLAALMLSLPAGYSQAPKEKKRDLPTAPPPREKVADKPGLFE